MVFRKKAARVIKELMDQGFEAYAVGGCVRDSILGRQPEDWDITTSARPEQVKQIFPRTVDTGIEHGTVTVLIDKETFEVTTYRVDGEYEDHRHPREVTFTASLEEDLKRRDFTINAMAYNPETGLVDIFHGIEDLEQGVIRCVGAPESCVLTRMRSGFCGQSVFRLSLASALMRRHSGLCPGRQRT